MRSGPTPCVRPSLTPYDAADVIMLSPPVSFSSSASSAAPGGPRAPAAAETQARPTAAEQESVSACRGRAPVSLPSPAAAATDSTPFPDTSIDSAELETLQRFEAEMLAEAQAASAAGRSLLQAHPMRAGEPVAVPRQAATAAGDADDDEEEEWTGFLAPAGSPGAASAAARATTPEPAEGVRGDESPSPGWILARRVFRASRARTQDSPQDHLEPPQASPRFSGPDEMLRAAQHPQAARPAGDEDGGDGAAPPMPIAHPAPDEQSGAVVDNEDGWPALPPAAELAPQQRIHPLSLLHRRQPAEGSAERALPKRRRVDEAGDKENREPSKRRNDNAAPPRTHTRLVNPAPLDLSWEAVLAVQQPQAQPSPAPPRAEGGAGSNDGEAGPAVASGCAAADPALKFTLPPPGGFAGVYGAEAGWEFENVKPEQVRRWLGVTQGSVVAVVHSDGALAHLVEQSRPPAASALGRCISQYLGCTGFSVSAPRPIIAPTTTDAAPFCLFISGLDDYDVSRLHDLGTLSTPTITVSFVAPIERRPRYLCSIDGYTTTAVLEVRDLIVQRLQHEDVVYRALQVAARIPKFRQLSVYNAFASLAASISVQFLDVKARGNISTPVFNVYSDLQTDDADVWAAWRHIFLGLDYHDDFFGLGALRTFPPCSLCRGQDHFRGMCPFPSVPGWHGPAIPPRRRPLFPRNR